MNVTQADVLQAATETGLSEEQGAALWRALALRSAHQPSFQSAHVAYYFGALIIAGAMGWFVTAAFDLLSGWQLSLVGVLYGAAGLASGAFFMRRLGIRVLGGICATVAVCMTPLAVFGMEKALHLWPAGLEGRYSEFHPYIRASWIYMEIATVLVGLAVLRFFKFPFITAPIAYSLWYMSMDLTAFLFHADWTFREQCWISIAFGAVMLLVSFLIDRRTSDDYAFWGYLFGTLTFWGGLSLLDSGNQVAKLGYACINGVMIIVSVLLNRKVFLVFGALGIFGYLATLAYTLFRNSIWFPFALTGFGIAIIAVGVLLQKKMPQWKAFLQQQLRLSR